MTATLIVALWFVAAAGVPSASTWAGRKHEHGRPALTFRVAAREFARPQFRVWSQTRARKCAS